MPEAEIRTGHKNKKHSKLNMCYFINNVSDFNSVQQLELEKALLSAEYESESLKLNQDEGEKIKVQMRINELERQMAEDNTIQANLQEEAKQRVQRAQQACNRLEEELTNCTDERMQKEVSEKLMAQQDVLESERKAFEDLEFHHLEEEASKLATREELQR